MRGIGAALAVWREVRAGKFASESLRRAGQSMSTGDMILASTLVYGALRRQSLWRAIYGRFLRRPRSGLSCDAEAALCIGTAGVLGLRNFAPGALVSGLVQAVKERGDVQGAGLVNAVLRRVVREGASVLHAIERSEDLPDRALASGLPSWVAEAWTNFWGDEANALFAMTRIRPYASFRVSSRADRRELVAAATAKGIRCWPSPLLREGIRVAGTLFPRDFPGYDEGLVTPQTESSMMVGLVLQSLHQGGPVLDMCSGRGVKSGHLLDLMPEAALECVELSPAKAAAARRELLRTARGGGDRASIHVGDALEFAPARVPSSILLDAPCSGSGTWNRHPEGKWRLTPEKLDSLAGLQVKLLKKALSLLAPGGIVVYSTCSLMKDENENVIAQVLAQDPTLRECTLPFAWRCLRRGRPLGAYIRPELPWLDGFYIAAIMKDWRGAR